MLKRIERKFLIQNSLDDYSTDLLENHLLLYSSRLSIFRVL